MRITALRTVQLPAPVPVYDLTVDEHHNFALADGCLVHNCGGFRKVRARHQALLPLSGKIANLLKLAAKARKSKKDQNVVEKALLSKAIMSLMSAIGYDPRAKDAIKRMQVGRIICLADADPDGGHINSLLLGFFYQMMPEVFEAGMVYIADMPEYISESGGKLIVGNSNEEVQTKLAKLKIKGGVKHLKGWGEADPEVLRVLAVNNSRKLIQIKPITSEDETLFEAIMATDVDARREALGISEEVHHE